VLETLAFFRDPDFARARFERYGDVYETSLLGQRTVFIRGGPAIADLFAQADAVEGWWPDSVRQLLGLLSLANRNGADHKARRRVVGQLFAAAALRRYSPAIVALVEGLNQDLAAAPAPVALVPRLRRFAFAVIATTVLGLDGADRDALFEDFEICCRGLFSFPLALPGILTGTIIGMARALGETAPLLMIGMRAFIASASARVPLSLRMGGRPPFAYAL
jgi:cytochrome P450